MAFFAHPTFDALTLQLTARDGDPTALTQRLGADWSAAPIAAQPGAFDLVSRAPVSIEDAWSAAHALGALDEVAFAEPAFVLSSTNTPEPGEDPAFDVSALALDPPPVAAEDELGWVARLIDADRVWADGIRGAGVRIGHPDSGYLPHPQLDSARIDLTRARDFVDHGADPDGPAADVSHGVSTASVIMSGAQGGPLDVLGIAPGALLVPLRVTEKHAGLPAPVLLGAGARRLRDAIDHARTSDCHVISISLGWFANRTLRAAIRAAIADGLIVLAAAGNYVRLVTWPAAYEEVIAVAGCTAARERWWGSSRGRAVDLTGPAHNVWRAYLEADGRTDVAPSSGTSFAVAAVAGVAALWLERHGGWAAVRARYPGHALQDVFRHVLAQTCDPPPVGHDGDFGVGIVNAARAVALLPAPADVPGAFAVDRLLGPLDGFSLLRASVGPPALPVTSALDLAPVADEVAFHVLTTPALRDAWLAHRPAAPRGRRARAVLERTPSSLLPRAIRGTLEDGLRARPISPALRARLR